MSEYDHKKIESKWQDKWQKEGIYEAKGPDPEAKDATLLEKSATKSKKFYGLVEFPYPSGAGLHIGHIRSNTAMDIITRKRRMEGYDVLYPMGWDAFGLPTENYAIKTGIQPSVVTKENTDTFRRQLKSLGFGFDWTREIDTTDPKYYKWTQWIFLEMLKRGLAYKKKMVINWCPKDKIGLANEEVVDGKCERCGTAVEHREKEQWMLAITKYADRLDRDLDTVDFLEKIKIQQRNWIGRSEGVNFKEKVKDMDIEFEVYDSIPQTFLAQTFAVIAPEHPLVPKLVAGIKQEKEVLDFVARIAEKKRKNKFDIDKDMEGIFTGRYVEDPFGTGDLPIWVASFVVADYGTGIVNCSAHDERDFAFAKKYNIPLREVMEPLEIKSDGPDAFRKDEPVSERDAVVCVIKHWSEEKYLCLEWKATGWHGFVVGGIERGETSRQAALREIVEETGYKNPELLRSLGGTVNAKFYQVLKKQNRFAHFKPLLFKLKDGERTIISNEEKGLHNIHWLTEEEVTRFMTFPDMVVIWERAIGKEKPIVRAGLLTAPEQFRGREWAESREDIIKYIEEKGYGSRAVHYKLRDWVFSRQRYWGEPIPVVYCDVCAKRKQKVLIIHGFEGSGTSGWVPWLKNELESRGFEVLAPTMTTAAHPTVESWMKELVPTIKDFSENDIIVGHSLGSKAALHLIEKTKKKIGNLFLIASAIGEIGDRDWDLFRKDWVGSDIDALKAFWQSPIDLACIDKYVSKVNLVLSDDDPFVPKKTHENIPKSWIYELWHGYEHFNDSKIPALLDLILTAKSTGWIPLPEKDLPLELPKVKNYLPTDTGESPLSMIDEWVNTKCPRCGGMARRETDTMPNWAGSSWYYLRYTDPKNASEFAATDKLHYWTPVDWYNGGMEHTTLHLLYSRFWHKFLYDLGLVPTSEPYAKRTSHGLILAEGGEKMSKSRGNVVNPDSLVEAYGADSVRMYEMFMGPFDQAVVWNSDSIIGVRRFLERVWRLSQKVAGAKENVQTTTMLETHKELFSHLHSTIKKVGEDIEEMRFNTCVSALMILLNQFEKHADDHGTVPADPWRTFLLLLASFAPHITEELWHAGEYASDNSIHVESWPKYDISKINTTARKIAVQVNGKTRGELMFEDISADDQTELEKLAKDLPEIKKWIAGKETLKVISVKGRLVNIVVK